MLSVIVLDLTFQEILSAVPTDPGAIMACVLIAAFLWFIWNRNRPAKPPAPPGKADDSSGAPGEKRGEAAAPQPWFMIRARKR